MRRVALLLIFSLCAARAVPLLSCILSPASSHASSFDAGLCASAYAASAAPDEHARHAIHAGDPAAVPVADPDSESPLDAGRPAEHAASHGKADCAAQFCCQWYVPGTTPQILSHPASPLIVTRDGSLPSSLLFADLFRPPQSAASR